MKSTGVFHCPDDPTAGSTSGGVTTYPVSYAGNLNFLRTDIPGPANDPRTGQSLASLTSPTKTVLLCEVRGISAVVTNPAEAGSGVVSSVTNGPYDGSVRPFGGFNNGEGGSLMTGCLGGLNCTPYINNPGGEGFAAATGLHTDGSNFMMCDGHIKWFRGASVSGGSNATAEDCNQWGAPAVADCGANSGMAAGTGSSQFAVTFSTK